MTTKRVGVVSQRIKSDLSVSNGEGIVLQHLEALPLFALRELLVLRDLDGISSKHVERYWK